MRTPGNTGNTGGETFTRRDFSRASGSGSITSTAHNSCPVVLSRACTAVPPLLASKSRTGSTDAANAHARTRP